MPIIRFDGSSPSESSGQVNDVPHAKTVVGHLLIHTRGTSEFFSWGEGGISVSVIKLKPSR